jgi:hypothetical protein
VRVAINVTDNRTQPGALLPGAVQEDRMLFTDNRECIWTSGSGTPLRISQMSIAVLQDLGMSDHEIATYFGRFRDGIVERHFGALKQRADAKSIVHQN